MNSIGEKKEIIIDNKKISIYYDNKSNKVPLIILNTFDENGEEIWNESKKIVSNNYILVTISNIDWNNEMSPWPIEKSFKTNEDYSLNADIYLKSLTNTIIPKIQSIINIELKIEISKIILAGYSLAGLFSIYSLYKTDIFDCIISCSGSLWYPNFIDYIKENTIMKKPEKIYFSLGNKESKTRNELMKKVEDNTKFIEEFYRTKGIKTKYEENEGNHFQDVQKRIIKAIKWILE